MYYYYHYHYHYYYYYYYYYVATRPLVLLTSYKLILHACSF